MSGTLAHLQSNERAALDACMARLHHGLGADVADVWLFGSKARGDSSPDSDIDLLIVLRHLQPPKRWRIREITADCSLEYDVLLNAHIVDQSRWDEEVRCRGTLWREVQRDGVPLLAELTRAAG